jgi:hypothetical protein
VEAHARVGHGGELLARHLELARGLLDERAGAAAARRLHVDLLGLAGVAGAVPGGREEDGLHVLAPDLGDEAHVRVEALHARRHRHHLLDGLGAHQRRDEPGARAGEEDPVAPGREAGLRLHAVEELEDLLGLPRPVALVVLPARAAVLDHHRLDGGGPDVDADELHAAAARRPMR